MKKIVLSTLFFIGIFTANATDYYLASNGSDRNKGTSSKSAWQTIAKLNTVTLKPGDNVLFRKGDTFVGEIKLKQSGVAGKPITLSAFGEGNLPVISGAKKLTGWKLNEAGFFVASAEDTIKNLYKNNILQNIARYPNSGWLRADSSKGESMLVDLALNENEGYWNGANVRMRTNDFTFETRRVKSYSKGKILFDSRTVYNLEKGWAYYLDNKLELLDTAGEWYQDLKQNKIYFKPESGNNIESLSIVGASLKNGISFIPGIKNILINELIFENFSENGITGEGGAQNITIQNCTFRNLGLGAITLIQGPKNISITLNNIFDIYGRGITLHEAENSIISDNKIRNIGLKEGYGIDGVNNGMGILIDKKNNNKVTLNLVENTGGVGIRLDGSNSLLENNVVKYTLLKLQDLGGIYSWGGSTHYVHHNIIRNNIVAHFGNGGNEATNHPHHTILNGIYLDNGSYYITLENNTIVGAPDAGIFGNEDTYGAKLIGNTFFDNHTAIALCDWVKKSKTFEFDFEVNNNIIFCTSGQQMVLSLTTLVDTTIHPGKFDNNLYANPFEWFCFERNVKYVTHKHRDQFYLEGWQKLYKQDLNSKAVYPVNTKAQNAQIYINEERNPKTISLGDYLYKDLYGNDVKGSFVLQPFSSRILYRAE